MSSILGFTDKSSSDGLGSPSAHEFLNFFNEKVEAVRRETCSSPSELSLVPPAASLSEFRNYEAETIEMVIQTAPSKFCSLNPIPTNILKEFLPEFLPFITRMCNMSLQEGAFQTASGKLSLPPA